MADALHDQTPRTPPRSAERWILRGTGSARVYSFCPASVPFIDINSPFICLLVYFCVGLARTNELLCRLEQRQTTPPRTSMFVSLREVVVVFFPRQSSSTS